MIPASPKAGDYSRLDLFLTPPHDCGYIARQQAATLFVDPKQRLDDGLYEYLLERGFRRSGNHVYRPYCADCSACIPVRIPVDLFQPSRNMRRVLRRNRDLRVSVSKPGYGEAVFDLYRRYLNHRHANGPMENPKPEDFLDFLTSWWCQSRFVEFWSGDRLLMVAVTDYLPKALSSVYTFFDPRESSRSLGTRAILWQIEESRRRRKSRLYLGYWIKSCQKMSYKARFRPLEIHRGAQWLELNDNVEKNL